MNAQFLAESVVHWLEFERLCDRTDLFSEAALRQPIGQFFKTYKQYSVRPEEDYPGPHVTRSKAIDFCLARRSGKTQKHAIECKWIAGNRAFTGEIFSDLYKLQHLKWPRQSEPCDRWMLLAGLWRSMQKTLEKESNLGEGQGRVSSFGDILATTVGQKAHHYIYTATKTAPLPLVKYWCEAAKELKCKDVVSSIRTVLKGKFPSTPIDDSYCCFVWRVGAPQGWGSKPIKDVLAKAKS